jgi:trimethylamine--corrinoid protein Co-methyltransferase
MAAELAKTTRKLGGIETFDTRDVGYITAIAEVVAGGAEALRRRPVLVGYAEMRSPLCLDRNMAEIFMAYVERGLPQTLDTMPNGGATAPMSGPGVLALGVAESMVGLVLAYAISPDAVVGLDLIPSYADMRSGIFRYAGAERWPLLGARLQLLQEFYTCPAGVHGGKTDACVPGVQVGVEKMASLLMPVLCGAVGVGTVGHLENAVTFSPEQLVIDNEIVGYVRRMIRGMDVNDETLAAEVIERVGIGGEYLSDEHTLRRFREEMHDSLLFERASWGQVYQGDLRGMQERARRRAQEILASDAWQPPLTREQEQAIDEIVAQAEAELGDGGQAG